MPTSDTFQVIYLGVQPIIDPTEGNAQGRDIDAENASQLVNRTFSAFTTSSVQTFSPGSYSSGDGSGSAQTNQTYNQDNSRGNDTFNITSSNGTVTQYTYDAGVQYMATITYSDGTSVVAPLNVIQSTSGATWVAPPSQFTPTAILLGARPILSIRLNSLNQDSYNGLYYQREIIEIITVPCFARGSMIRTDLGDVAVEDLKPGDLVVTRDNGPQPVRWIGKRRLDAVELATSPRLRPIRISTGALAPGLPESDLFVSPQHRILVRSRIALRMFGTDEVLVAAKSLLLLDGIDIDTAADEVEYFHIMFDQHQIIFANGAETESLYAGAEALKGIGEAAAKELLTLFPELADDTAPVPARTLTSGRMGRKLTMRHLQNVKPLQAS